MQLTENLLQQMENLAYLQIEDKGQMINAINSTLEQVNAVLELDTQGAEELVHIHGLHNVTRADEVQASLKREILLQNAAYSEEEGFVVPKILG